MPAERRVSSTVVSPVRVTDAVAVLPSEKSAFVAYSTVAVPDEAPEPKEATLRVTTPRVTVADGATENVAEELKDSSVIVASYDAGDGTKGLIGVVGPTRMDYSAIASKLSFLAQGLSRRLGGGEAPVEGMHNKLIIKGDDSDKR